MANGKIAPVLGSQRIQIALPASQALSILGETGLLQGDGKRGGGVTGALRGFARQISGLKRGRDFALDKLSPEQLTSLGAPERATSLRVSGGPGEGFRFQFLVPGRTAQPRRGFQQTILSQPQRRPTSLLGGDVEPQRLGAGITALG